MKDSVDITVNYSEDIDVSVDINDFLEELEPEQWTYILEWILEDLSEKDIKTLKSYGYEEASDS